MYYGTITPSGKFFQQTYTTHPWVITDEGGDKQLGVIVPLYSNLDVEIK